MDEFKDLDKELEKLKQELNLLDASAANPPVRGMDTSDYWRRRLEEEKLLWDKKMAFSDQEKKHLTEKLAEQEKRLQQYEENFKKLQEQMERDNQLWQERLRAKETDLLLEKNRLLWEDKIRQLNGEIEKYLKDISDLNQQIVHLKDQQQQEKEQWQESLAAEKKNLQQQISLLNQEIQLRENALAEFKNKSETEIRASNEKIAELTGELENRQQQIKELSEKINQLQESQKEILQRYGHLENNLAQKTAEFLQWAEQQARIVENLLKNFSRLSRKEKIKYLAALKQQLAQGPEIKTAFPFTIPGRSRALPYLLVALALTIILAFWPKVNSAVGLVWQKLNYQRIYETAYPHPSGIYFDGKDIWVSDWQGQAVYRHNPKNLSLEKVYYLPGGHLNAITGNQQYLYGYDAWNQTIYQLRKNGYLNIAKKINLKEILSPESAVNFSAIAINENYLWASDIVSGQIYQIDLERKKVLKTYRLSGTIVGMAIEGEKIYFLDAKNYRILEYDLGNWREEKTLALPDSYRKNFQPTALTFRNNYCWIISEKDGRIYRYFFPD